jgi:hypothetical protein
MVFANISERPKPHYTHVASNNFRTTVHTKSKTLQGLNAVIKDMTLREFAELQTTAQAANAVNGDAERGRQREQQRTLMPALDTGQGPYMEGSAATHPGNAIAGASRQHEITALQEDELQVEDEPSPHTTSYPGLWVGVNSVGGVCDGLHPLAVGAAADGC